MECATVSVERCFKWNMEYVHDFVKTEINLEKIF